MDISFVINSYGRPAQEISGSIKSCLNQVSNHFQYEVVFVDQNKNQLNLDENQIIHVHFPETSISKARNKGAFTAQGDWLIFVDDDAELSANYLHEFFNLHQKYPSCSVWSGTIFLKENHTLFYSKRQDIVREELGFLELKVLMGGNLIIKRNLFAAIGKFDEQFGIGSKYPSSEDTDLAWRLYYAGFPIRLSHQLQVYHPAPAAITMKKAYRYGLGKGALVNKWLFREHKLLTLFEMTEMLIVPLLKIIIDLKSAPTHLGTFIGRIKGFLRFRSR